MKLKLLPILVVVFVGCASQPREIGFGGIWRPNPSDVKNNNSNQQIAVKSIQSTENSTNSENQNTEEEFGTAEKETLNVLHVPTTKIDPVNLQSKSSTQDIVASLLNKKTRTKLIKNTGNTPKEEQIGWGIASLACSFFGSFVPLPFVLGIPLIICGIVFGAMGLKRKLRGLAIAGMALGLLDVFLIIILIIMILTHSI